MLSLAFNPTHRFHPVWERHCQLLPEVSGLTARDVATWTVEEVVSFIQCLPGCREYASVFREALIDGEAFLCLRQSDIVKGLGIELGPALNIYNAILMFSTAKDN
ncbi:LMBL1 protein, partial [Bucorvus abyssinicus]|nr:LMBL1 protein [Bucorvus abyssinicus]